MVYAEKPVSRMYFGRFILDAAERQLYYGAERVHLNPKEIELLAMLACSAPTPLSKDSITRALWAEGAPSDAALSQTVYRLRCKLAECDFGRSYIETIPKFGFRLIYHEPVEHFDTSTVNRQPLSSADEIALCLSMEVLRRLFLTLNTYVADRQR